MASEGVPGGESGGTTYTRPEGTYGPFRWTVTDGDGERTTAEGVTINYTTKNVARCTPSEPGVSYITASSSDGAYSVNFAVVCAGVQAETIELDTHDLDMDLGDTASLTATGDLSAFTDVGTVSAYAVPAMTWAVENGILYGTSTTTLPPAGHATRIQLTLVACRYCTGA